VSLHQKGKTNLNSMEQETVSGSGISWATCKPAPRLRQITMPASHRSIFYRPDAFSAAKPTESKHNDISTIILKHVRPSMSKNLASKMWQYNSIYSCNHSIKVITSIKRLQHCSYGISMGQRGLIPAMVLSTASSKNHSNAPQKPAYIQNENGGMHDQLTIT